MVSAWRKGYKQDQSTRKQDPGSLNQYLNTNKQDQCSQKQDFSRGNYES